MLQLVLNFVYYLLTRLEKLRGNVTFLQDFYHLERVNRKLYQIHKIAYKLFSIAVVVPKIVHLMIRQKIIVILIILLHSLRKSLKSNFEFFHDFSYKITPEGIRRSDEQIDNHCFFMCAFTNAINLKLCLLE